MPREGTKRGKGGKYKRSRVAKHSLTKEDVKYLKENTKYNEEEIREWYRGFKEDCPDGQLGRDKIRDMYSMILPPGNLQVFVDQIFKIFDKDGNGSIDFREFMMATDMTSSGTPEEKLRWAFKMYDRDGSGTIEQDEIVDIIETLYGMEGITSEAAGDKANRIFKQLDVNGDGELDEEEFIKGCTADADLMKLLNSGGIDADSDAGE